MSPYFPYYVLETDTSLNGKITTHMDINNYPICLIVCMTINIVITE